MIKILEQFLVLSDCKNQNFTKVYDLTSCIIRREIKIENITILRCTTRQSEFALYFTEKQEDQKFLTLFKETVNRLHINV